MLITGREENMYSKYYFPENLEASREEVEGNIEETVIKCFLK